MASEARKLGLKEIEVKELMMKATATLELLWTPSEDKIVGSRLWDYMSWLDERQGRKFEDYEDLWRSSSQLM